MAVFAIRAPTLNEPPNFGAGVVGRVRSLVERAAAVASLGATATSALNTEVIRWQQL